MTQETNLLDIDAACLIEEADVQTTPVVEVINVESKDEPKKRGRKKRILQSTGGGENNDSTTSAVDDKKEEKGDEEQIYIPSGVTLVDLASSDTTHGFCTAGHTVNIIGDRNSGKSMMCMASMAETYHRHGDIFEYDYYDYERAVSFDVPRLSDSYDFKTWWWGLKCVVRYCWFCRWYRLWYYILEKRLFFTTYLCIE